MKFIFLALFSVGLLCTCGPAQDKPDRGSDTAGVLAAERVFNGAYQNLDAAVLERMLADDFTLTYADQDTEKGKDRWLGELGQLRTVFPQLEISTDSLEILMTDPETVVSGVRTFSWSTDGEQGSYRERFTNRWQQAGKGYRLIGTELQ